MVEWFFNFPILLFSCCTQHNCDPRFFTTVVFYVGSVCMTTCLKFEVFDVYNQKEHKMCAIGQVQCQVMELLMSAEQVVRLEVKYDGATSGYIIVRAWRVRMGVGGWMSGGVSEVYKVTYSCLIM